MFNRKPKAKTGAEACKYIHEVAAAEMTVYDEVLSYSAMQHLAACNEWQITRGPERWEVIRTPQALRYVEYICEHDWKSTNTCAKCGIKEADAYRLPTIDKIPTVRRNKI